MPSLVVKRIGLALLLMAGVTFCIYAATRIGPGDPCLRTGRIEKNSPEYKKCVERLFLNRSVPVGYVKFVVALASGDLVSVDAGEDGTPVVSEFLERFPKTAELAAAAMVLAVLAGVPAGIAAATRRESSVDRLIMGTAVVGYAMPIFWWGHIFIEGLGGLGVAADGCNAPAFYSPPVTRTCVLDALISGDLDAFGSALQRLVSAAIVLGTIPLAVVARQTRSAMVEALGEDYVRAARARGLSTRRVMLRHALRGALLPVVTVTGLQVSVLLGGAVLTETVFSRGGGIGLWIVQSITSGDLPVTQGVVSLVVVLVVLVNLVIDLLCGFLDPRIRVRS